MVEALPGLDKPRQPRPISPRLRLPEKWLGQSTFESSPAPGSAGGMHVSGGKVELP